MRPFLPLAVLFFAVAAAAQERPISLYAFITNPAVESRSSGDAFEGAVGLALGYQTPAGVRIELSVAQQRNRAFVYTGNGYETQRFDSQYGDLDVTYQFANDTWKPYIGGGLRYNNTQSHYFFGYGDRPNRLSPEVNGGVTWQFLPTMGGRIDVKHTTAHVFEDESFKASIGLQWRW